MTVREKNMGVIIVHKKVTPACLIKSKSPVAMRSAPHSSSCDGRALLSANGKAKIRCRSAEKRRHTYRPASVSVPGCPTYLPQDSLSNLQVQLKAEQRDLRAITQPILDTENSLVKEVDQVLWHGQTLGQRRRELLHKRWSEAVWTPIQRSVEQHVTEAAPREPQRLRSLLLHYIQHCNAKGYVFLDTYDPLEYNPFLFDSGTAYTSKVTTPCLKDPLLLQSRNRMKEKSAVLHCQTGHVYTRDQVEEILKRSLHPSPQCCSTPMVPTSEPPSLDTPTRRESSPWTTNRGKSMMCGTAEDGRCYCCSTTTRLLTN
ncbi:protein FAM228A isoform X2 [Engraulis encrasicolus]|uniref:protein FAM228A isoform X2 n=1 Tax=Engraulis encrasicolus TaxID=184585 RepID=UPI002FD1FFD2